MSSVIRFLREGGGRADSAIIAETREKSVARFPMAIAGWRMARAVASGKIDPAGWHLDSDLRGDVSLALFERGRQETDIVSLG